MKVVKVIFNLLAGLFWGTAIIAINFAEITCILFICFMEYIFAVRLLAKLFA